MNAVNQGIKDRFKSCRSIFISYKILVPVLIVMIGTVLGIGLNHNKGLQADFQELRDDMGVVKEAYKVQLSEIQQGIDTLLKRSEK